MPLTLGAVESIGVPFLAVTPSPPVFPDAIFNNFIIWQIYNPKKEPPRESKMSEIALEPKRAIFHHWNGEEVVLFIYFNWRHHLRRSISNRLVAIDNEINVFFPSSSDLGLFGISATHFWAEY